MYEYMYAYVFAYVRTCVCVCACVPLHMSMRILCVCTCAGAFKSVCADGGVHEDIPFDALLRALLSESSTQKLEHIDEIFQKLLLPDAFLHLLLSTTGRGSGTLEVFAVCFAGGRECGGENAQDPSEG